MEKPILNNLDYKANSYLVLGVKRTGKSTLASRLVHLHPAPLVLIYDWQGGEFAHRLGAPLAQNREDLAALIDAGHRIVCYDAESGEAEPEGDGFDWFCEMAFELSGTTAGRKLIVVDESQDLIDPYNIPDSLKKVLTRGGRREMDTCLIGSAANALHNVGRNQVSELFCFRCVDENARKFPVSLGLDDQRIKSLPDCRFIHLDMRTGQQNELGLWDKKSNG